MALRPDAGRAHGRAAGRRVPRRARRPTAGVAGTVSVEQSPSRTGSRCSSAPDRPLRRSVAVGGRRRPCDRRSLGERLRVATGSPSAGWTPSVSASSAVTSRPPRTVWWSATELGDRVGVRRQRPRVQRAEHDGDGPERRAHGRRPDRPACRRRGRRSASRGRRARGRSRRGRACGARQARRPAAPAGPEPASQPCAMASSRRSTRWLAKCSWPTLSSSALPARADLAEQGQHDVADAGDGPAPKAASSSVSKRVASNASVGVDERLAAARRVRRARRSPGLTRRPRGRRPAPPRGRGPCAPASSACAARPPASTGGSRHRCALAAATRTGAPTRAASPPAPRRGRRTP